MEIAGITLQLDHPVKRLSVHYHPCRSIKS
jgi:hypothetical protein